ADPTTEADHRPAVRDRFSRHWRGSVFLHVRVKCRVDSIQRSHVANVTSAPTETDISRDQLAALSNEDLSREYQAIIRSICRQPGAGGSRMGVAAPRAAAFITSNARPRFRPVCILNRAVPPASSVRAETSWSDGACVSDHTF